jgi:hypothetical protein
MGCVSIKPTALLDAELDVTATIEKCLEKAGIIFFFTAGPGDVYAWDVPKGSDIVTCAGRIHTDLAKSFIKGDIASFDDFMKCHNWNECVKKGVVQVVDRGDVVPPGSIIEIRSGMAGQKK